METKQIEKEKPPFKDLALGFKSFHRLLTLCTDIISLHTKLNLFFPATTD